VPISSHISNSLSNRFTKKRFENKNPDQTVRVCSAAAAKECKRRAISIPYDYTTPSK
jgi:hypothetical protein